MRKALNRLLLLGVGVGAVYAARRYALARSTGVEVAQVVFDDGSTRPLTSKAAEGEELTDLARKLIETGI